jgi:hypothetical protein
MGFLILYMILLIPLACLCEYIQTLKELIALTRNIPFDDRINPSAEINDLKYPLIKNYLSSVNITFRKT